MTTISFVATVPVVPVNSVLPVISGTAQDGSPLSVTNGTFSGPPTGYIRVWRAGGVTRAATGTTYLCTSADVGLTINCTVTATNAAGSVTATSAATAAVTSASETFTAGMWKIQPSGSAGEIYIIINTKPTALKIYKRFECSIAGGAAFEIAAGRGMQNITGVTNGDSVRIRTVLRGSNVAIDGATSAWSDTKTAVVSVDTRTVLTTSTFAAALASAVSGQRMYLAAGNYGSLWVNLKTFDPPLVIRADNPASPPVFSSDVITNSVGVTFRETKIQGASLSTVPHRDYDSYINSGSSQISYIDCTRIGSLGTNSTGSEAIFVGYPVQYAQVLDACTAIMYLRDTRHTWLTGFVHGETTDVTVFGGSCANITEDMFIGSGPNCFIIDGFTFKDWNFPPNNPQSHQDCFQLFMVGGGPRMADGIMIRNSKLHTGAQVELCQTFFFKNEMYNTPGEVGYQKLHKNIFVENNLLYNGFQGCINMYYIDGFTVDSNTLIRNKAVTVAANTQYGINSENQLEPGFIYDFSINGSFTNNVGQNMPTASGSITVSGNLLIQHVVNPNQATSPYGYNVIGYDANADGVAEIFAANCPQANIKAKAGSIIYTGSYGSSLFRP